MAVAIGESDEYMEDRDREGQKGFYVLISHVTLSLSTISLNNIVVNGIIETGRRLALSLYAIDFPESVY